MLFGEAFKLALQSLWANKMRTILTLIGVVMGVASVIMVITLVNGANNYVSTKILNHGADVFTVRQMPGVIFSAEEYFRYQKRKILRGEDYEAIRDDCTECSEVGMQIYRSTSVSYHGHSSTDTYMRGMTWTMVSLDNLDIALGRGFTPSTMKRPPTTSSWATTLWTTCLARATRWARRSASTAFPTPSLA